MQAIVEVQQGYFLRLLHSISFFDMLTIMDGKYAKLGNSRLYAVENLNKTAMAKFNCLNDSNCWYMGVE